MSVEGFSPITQFSTSMFAPISDWGTKLVAPLGSSLMSKDGMMELAGRVFWIFGLVIAAVFVARKCGYLTGRAASTDTSSTKLAKASSEVLGLINKMKLQVEQLPDIEQKKQLEQLIKQLEQALERPIVQLEQEINQIGVFYDEDSPSGKLKCLDKIIKGPSNNNF